jgi:hypothetical protein
VPDAEMSEVSDDVMFIDVWNKLGLDANSAAWGFNGCGDCGAANGGNWMGVGEGRGNLFLLFLFPILEGGGKEVSWRWGRSGDEVTEERKGIRGFYIWLRFCELYS